MQKALEPLLQDLASKISVLITSNERENAEEKVKVFFKDNACGISVIVSNTLKELIEAHDTKKSLRFVETKSDNDGDWKLVTDSHLTEIGILRCFVAEIHRDMDHVINIQPKLDIVQPDLEKIQDCVAKTIDEICNKSGLPILAKTFYSVEEELFIVEVTVDAYAPLVIQHSNPEIFMIVIHAGLPQMIKELLQKKEHEA
jgi:hypothetical protein